MRHVRLAVALALAVFISTEARAVTLDDVQFWVGSGTNRTGLVIDWNDGKSPLLWGYRWDAPVTAEQMFRDIVSADDRLFAKASIFNFGGPDVLLINGVGYDRDSDGFALSDGTVFTDGLKIGSPSDGATATDGDDSYVEGFNTGFWAYYIADGNPYLGDTWDEAQTGISETLVTNGGFHGFSFAPQFVSGTPDEPTPAAAPGVTGAATPEPSAVVLLLCGAAGLVLRRR